MTDAAHAQAAKELAEGSQRAAIDFFEKEIDDLKANPFTGGWQRIAWENRLIILICQRDHGKFVCCQEHIQHKTRWNKAYMGYTSCIFCETEVDKLREKAKEKQNDGEDRKTTEGSTQETD